MWPMLLDYTKDESKRILRRLELEAYASIISVFRAQGDLSKDKKKILQDLQQTLSISTERHRAEVRRAINDEKLATIADNIAGTISTAEWMIEGRRLVPLMPRLVPQTAFTATANQAATAMMEKNASLPPPSQTSNKDGPAAVLPKQARASSPTSNVVVLPSGTSIHIKGMLNQDDEEELNTSIPSRRSSHRSLSTDSQNASSVSTQTPRITYTTASSTLPNSSPVKITISKSPQGRPISVQSSSQPPKVILVTSAGSVSGTTVIQRSMSIPVVRTPPSTLSTYSGTGPPRSSVLIPGGSSSSGPQVVSAFPNVATSTSSASLVSTTVTMPTSCMGASPAVFSPSVQIGLGKVRPRMVPRQRYPAMIPNQKPGIVIPMGPQLVSPPQSVSTSYAANQPQHSTSGIQVTPTQHTAGGIQVKTLSKPTIQIKQEGGMKIITQSGTSKILPKPTQIAGSGGTPVVMVNTAQGTVGSTSAVTMLPRSISSYTTHSGGKVLNITTPGGRVIATTTKATNVVTVNPKTLHLTAVKSGSGSTTVSKPNVIVVQKTQHARFQSPMGQGGTNIRTITTSSLPGAIDKELMGLVHKDSQGRHVLTASSPSITTSSSGRGGERRVIITTSGGISGEVKQPVSIIHRRRADSEGKISSLLAELIQGAGIMPSDGVVETAAQGTDPYDFENYDTLPQTSSSVSLSTSSSAPFQQGQQPLQISRLPVQRRLQPEAGEGSAEEETTGFGVQTEERRGSQDSDSGPEQVFTIEQAMSLLNKEMVDLTEQEPVQTTAPTSLLPSILTSTPAISTIAQLHGQPKVSILSTARMFDGDSTRESTTTVQSSESGLGGITVSPEEGLKEGQLDTQTGLFYKVSTVDRFGTSSKPSQPLNLQPQPSSLPPPPPASSSSSSSASSSHLTTSSSSALGQTAPGPTLSSSSLSLTQAPLDLLSCSLAEAQINLEPFHDDEEEEEEEEYDEEEEEEGEGDLEDEVDNEIGHVETHNQSSVSPLGQVTGETSVSSRPGMAEVLREETAKDGTRILTVSNPASSQQESAIVHGNLLVSLPSQLSRSSSLPSSISSSSVSPPSSFVPVQEMPRPSSAHKISSSISQNVPSPAQPVLSHKSSPQPSVMPIAVSVAQSPSVITFKLDELTGQRTGTDEEQATTHLFTDFQQASVSGSALETSISSTESGADALDTLASFSESAVTMQQEDYIAGGSDGDSHSDGLASSDPSGLIRSSKRKRKHPSGLDEPSQAAAGSWVKTAASLLMKIARFKGSPREKTEIPAAEWFTFPVDPQDAPDYYTVVQNPMDFSTMRKKLETGQYSGFEDFQSDMDLIRTNCYLYNSEGTKVRRDCDEVMAFYRSELSKLQEKQVNKAFMPNVTPVKRPKVEDRTFQKP